MSRYTQYFSKNNVKSELYVGISSLATQIQVASGQGELRGTNFPCLGTLESFNSSNEVIKREIVKVVSRNGDTFTVIRKFAPCPPSDESKEQGQVSFSFDAGDSFSLYITSEILDSISQAINDLYNNGNDRLFVKKTAGLGFEITPGNVRFETGEAYYPGGTGIAVDNATSYIQLDSSFNVLITTDELFDVQNISLAEIKAVNGEITEIITRKIDGIAGKMGGGGTGPYGDGSDGDLIISENTILNAGQQYQFSNLTICPGATVSFTGCGGAKIKVANLFCNMGTIEMTDINVDSHEYRDANSFCLIKNCTREGSCFEAGKGGLPGCPRYSNGYATAGGDACDGPDPSTGTCHVGTGASAVNTKGGNGFGCGAGGGKGERAGCYGTNSECASTGTGIGCSGSGFNGGTGGIGACSTCTYNGIASGGGGGGGFYTGNGGNGGNAYLRYSSTSNNNGKLATREQAGGDGGNGGILGCGGNGGNGCSSGAGGNGGDGFYKGGNGGNGGNVVATNYGVSQGGDGGNGGNGYYGGNGGNGGNGCNACTRCGVQYGGYCAGGGAGGQGGMGIVPGKGGNGGTGGIKYGACGTCGGRYGVGGKGGQGGKGQSYLHSLNIKACCFCNLGCILSVGAVGGQGGNGGAGGCYSTTCSYGGNGGQGGDGGNGGMIQIITDEVLEKGCISVAGGIGGAGGTCGINSYNADYNGKPGCQGNQGESGTLYFFLLEG